MSIPDYQQAIDAVFEQYLRQVDGNRRHLAEMERAVITEARRHLAARLEQLGLTAGERESYLCQLEWEVRAKLPGR